MSKYDPESMPPSAVKEILAAGVSSARAITLEGRKPVVLVPEGYTIESLDRDDLPELPDHIRQSVKLDDLDSFTAYVKRSQTAQTVIFANSQTPGFTAFFDYHHSAKDDGGLPARVAHKASYLCPLSAEWQIWSGQNSKPMSQAGFVEFIDNNSCDVTAPESAALLELAQNFEMRSSVEFQSDIKRTTGGKVLKFVEQVDAGRTGAGGDMRVPDELQIFIPVFDAGKKFPLTARMEFRVSGGKLAVTFHLRRPQESIRAALADIRKDIEAATGIVPLTGSLQ